MDIIEHKNYDKKLRISKIPMTCDDRGNIPEPLPPYNFAMLIVGRPSSGKTNLIVNLVNKKGKFYNKKFNRVLIFSPSLNTLDTELKLPSEQIFTDISISELNEELNYLKEMLQEDPKYKTLFIFDDMINNFKNDIPEFLKILYNRRHYGLSVIIVSQVYNKLPMQLRKAVSHLILFKPPKQEIESVHRDAIHLKKDDFEKLIKYVYDKKYQFLFIDLNENKYYKNFNKLDLKEK